jgi:hypothetical protein
MNNYGPKSQTAAAAAATVSARFVIWGRGEAAHYPIAKRTQDLRILYSVPLTAGTPPVNRRGEFSKSHFFRRSQAVNEMEEMDFRDSTPSAPTLRTNPPSFAGQEPSAGTEYR